MIKDLKDLLEMTSTIDPALDNDTARKRLADAFRQGLIAKGKDINEPQWTTGETWNTVAEAIEKGSSFGRRMFNIYVAVNSPNGETFEQVLDIIAHPKPPTP